MNVSNAFGLPDFLKTDAIPVEINFYGAAKMVADRLGIKNPPTSYVSWAHGWRAEEILYANQLAYDCHIGIKGQPNDKITIPAHKRRPYLVPTKAQEALLRENGFPDTRAVGLPFVYVDPDPTVKRIPGSLLVMPAHVLAHMEEGRTDEIQYLEYIKSIAHQFSRVVFCINLGCLGSGLWINNLEKYGFDYLFGAGMMDQMALFRMRRLFDTFEYMTSNGIGSHFIYAGLCGVKVSLAGPMHTTPADIFKNEPEWQDPERRKTYLMTHQLLQQDRLQARFPWLYTDPITSKPCVEWAKEETGYDNKVSFETLAQLFGWIGPTASQHESFIETVMRLNTDSTLPELVQFIQGTQHNMGEMLTSTMQLLAKTQLRPAYLLAMLLAKKGQQHVAISLALAVGGLIYHNSIESANGLARLQPLADALSVEQQTLLQKQMVIPLMSPLLTAAIDQTDDLRIASLLTILKAVDPTIRALLDPENSAQKEAQGLEQAHKVIDVWGKA